MLEGLRQEAEEGGGSGGWPAVKGNRKVNETLKYWKKLLKRYLFSPV